MRRYKVHSSPPHVQTKVTAFGPGVEKAKVQEKESAKLLGITMDNDQKWNSHFWGKKGPNHGTDQTPGGMVGKRRPRIPDQDFEHKIWKRKTDNGEP